MTVSWDSSESHLLLNPTYSQEEKNLYRKILDQGKNWPGHIWLATSGSSALKWVGISKEALLASAQEVNTHLQAQSFDSWVNPLPDFHVGGVGIYARSFLTGSKVYDFRKEHGSKWNVDQFYQYLKEKKGTLTSLVPTQVHDLIDRNYEAPPSLRAVIVGGGKLLPVLYEKGIALKWPLLPSYGMTECGSQLATASLQSLHEDKYPALPLLSHVKGKEKEKRLCFSGPSLLSCYALLDKDHFRFIDPKIEGWFETEDRGTIFEESIHFEGRNDSMIKIGGESVDLDRLEEILQSLAIEKGIMEGATIAVKTDARLGHSICLFIERIYSDQLDQLIEEFQKKVLPFEKIRHSFIVDQFPRSSLGKILKSQLIKKIV